MKLPDRPYTILTIALRANRDFEATIHGPGFGAAGRRTIFATEARARDFVQALNIAYAEGVKEGSAQASPRSQARSESSGNAGSDI
jgi:hypothetical protein